MTSLFVMFIMVYKISSLLPTYCLYNQHYKNLKADEICVAYICAHSISYIEMFIKEPKVI